MRDTICQLSESSCPIRAAVTFVVFVLAGAASSTSSTGDAESARISIDETAPWKVRMGDRVPEPCPNEAGWLTPTVVLDKQSPKLILRLDLADVPGLDGRAPIAVEDFAVTLEAPRGLTQSRSTPAGWSLFWIDEDWDWNEPGGSGWTNVFRAGRTRLELPPAVAGDVTALGVYVSLSGNAPSWHRYAGVIRVRVDRLVVRAGPIEKPPLPEKGPLLESLAGQAGWRIEPSHGGGREVTRVDGLPRLGCDLEASDEGRRSSVARLDLPPADMREQGLFITVEVPAELVTTEKFKAGMHAGLYSGDEVFWGPWQPLMRPGKTTVALYPEVRFPLPLALRSEAFDPSKVDAIALRVTVDQATEMAFDGSIEILEAQLVGAPPALLERRAATQAALDRLPLGASPEVPIDEFLRHVGVNYPWPQHRNEGVYPVVCARTWDKHGTEAGLPLISATIARDLRWLATHRVSLVRVWLLGDLRRGLTTNENGEITLHPECLRDLDVLLTEAERAKIDLIPVLLDFTLADGQQRERLGRVGERQNLLEDPELRQRFLSALQPVLERLVRSKAVRMIDLWNEPGQMRVGMDAAVATISELVRRLRDLDEDVLLTVGVRSSIDLPFWMRIGLDVPTFHWFSKMEPNVYPKAWAPEGVWRAATIVTEIEATGGVYRTLTELRRAGFLGGLIWSVGALDGISPFGPEEAQEFLRWVRDHEP